MSIRTACYLVCTDCGDQFQDPEYGGYFSSGGDAKEQAGKQGWHCGVQVKNGSEWDFCPECWANHISDES